MNHHLSFALIRERDMLKCAYTEEMFQGESRFLTAKLTISLEITRVSLLEMEEGHTITIPAAFLAQCASLAYGTMRGVVIDRTVEAGIHDIIMPPKYLQKVNTQPMVVNVENVTATHHTEN